MTVELIYDADCPNVETARDHLRRALAQLGISPRWTEWDSADPKAPSRVRGYGSPTVLINGRDITGAAPAGAPACRVLFSATGEALRAPSVEMIARALTEAQAGSGDPNCSRTRGIPGHGGATR